MMLKYRTPLFLAAAIALTGCCTDEYLTSTCGALPSGQVTQIEVTIRTGDEGTNADIYFCYALIGTPRGFDNCQILDDIANNFEAGQTETFTVRADFPASEFDTFWIENRGGGILGESAWDIDALRVTLRADSGDVVLYQETNIICNERVSKDDQYLPGGCIWDR